jgi:hypothetical protein
MPALLLCARPGAFEAPTTMCWWPRFAFRALLTKVYVPFPAEDVSVATVLAELVPGGKAVPQGACYSLKVSPSAMHGTAPFRALRS